MKANEFLENKIYEVKYTEHYETWQKVILLFIVLLGLLIVMFLIWLILHMIWGDFLSGEKHKPQDKINKGVVVHMSILGIMVIILIISMTMITMYGQIWDNKTMLITRDQKFLYRLIDNQINHKSIITNTDFLSNITSIKVIG